MDAKSLATFVLIFCFMKLSDARLDKRRITSINYPMSYTRSQLTDNTQHYSDSADNRIRIVVGAMELHPSDTLTIYDGLNNCKFKLKEFYGSTPKSNLPMTFFSISERICVRFERFYGGYKGYDIDIFEFPRCRGTLTDEYGDIVSPNYNFVQYEANSNCEWRIQAEPGQAVKFNVAEFTVRCANGDDVTINGGVGSLCARKTKVLDAQGFIAATHNVSVNFKSNSKAKGFWLKYRMIGCRVPTFPGLYGLPENLVTVGGGYYYDGYVVVYRCPVGSRANDENTPMTATCTIDGTWRTNTKPQQCKPVYCGDPGMPRNAVRLFTAGYQYASVVHYQCDSTYTLVGGSQRTCRADGTWSGQLPQCEGHKLTECSLPGDPEFGSRKGTNNTIGSSIEFVCDAGHKLTGDKIIICQPSAEWSNTPPTCEIVRCPTPQIPKNGHMQNGEPQPFYEYRDYVQYECDKGYKYDPLDNATTSCTELGTWSHLPPLCEAITCPQPTLPQNGQAIVEGLTYGSITRYQCNVGYSLDGAVVSQCLDAGWSSTVPMCDPVPCPRVTNETLVNAHVTSLGGPSSQEGTWYFGGNITVSCDAGFTLDRANVTLTSMTVTCTASGQWSRDVTRGCAYQILCPKLRNSSDEDYYIIHRNSVVNVSVVGDSVSVQCVRTGKQVRVVCGADGYWSDNLDTVCTQDEIQCPELIRNSSAADDYIINRDSVDNGNFVGDSVSVKCVRTGKQVRLVCGANGSWSDDLDAVCSQDDDSNNKAERTHKGKDDRTMWIIIAIAVASTILVSIIGIIIIRQKRNGRNRANAAAVKEDREYDNPAYGIQNFDADGVIIVKNGAVAFSNKNDDWKSNPTFHNVENTLRRPDSLYDDEGIYSNTGQFGAGQ